MARCNVQRVRMQPNGAKNGAKYCMAARRLAQRRAAGSASGMALLAYVLPLPWLAQRIQKRLPIKLHLMRPHSLYFLQ